MVQAPGQFSLNVVIIWWCNKSGLCGSPWSSPEVAITRVLTSSLSELHFPSSRTRTLIASSPDAHLWDYLSHTHTHSSQSLVLPRLTFLSVLIFLCWIIVFWPWTVSLVLDCYLPAFWPSCLPWYSALVSPLISLLPLPTIACTTVLTLIKAANGSPLRWLIITDGVSAVKSIYWIWKDTKVKYPTETDYVKGWVMTMHG